MHKVFTAKLISQTPLNEHYRVISFYPLSEEISQPLPGQFYMIQVSEGTDPLLKRPFSIFSHEKGLLKFLYRIIGKGTRLLSSMSDGKVIQMIGPLGIPYPPPSGEFIAIAGGTGIASIHYLLQKHLQRGILFYGAKSQSEIVLSDDFHRKSKEVILCTDDGSCGVMGTTMDVIGDYTKYKGLPIYACGPKAMLKALSQWAILHQQICFVSLEERMACGIGACLSCVVKTNSGLKSVCKDGAVFNAEEIVWD